MGQSFPRMWWTQRTEALPQCHLQSGREDPQSQWMGKSLWQEKPEGCLWAHTGNALSGSGYQEKSPRRGTNNLRHRRNYPLNHALLFPMHRPHVWVGVYRHPWVLWFTFYCFSNFLRPKSLVVKAIPNEILEGKDRALCYSINRAQ